MNVKRETQNVKTRETTDWGRSEYFGDDPGTIENAWSPTVKLFGIKTYMSWGRWGRSIDTKLTSHWTKEPFYVFKNAHTVHTTVQNVNMKRDKHPSNHCANNKMGGTTVVIVPKSRKPAGGKGLHTGTKSTRSSPHRPQDHRRSLK